MSTTPDSQPETQEDAFDLQMHFAVDIPDINANLSDEDEHPYASVDYFYTREEAIAFARKHYGADETGCVCLVSQF